MKKVLGIIFSLIICLGFALSGCGAKKIELGNVLILGDSYSTFQGYLPSGYLTWYSTSENYDHSDVFKVEDTWWWQVLDATKSNLVENSSYSGSLICNAKDSYTSFITRFDLLATDGTLETNPVDTVFIFGGLNDDWSGARMGDNKYSDWTDTDLEKVFPAFCYLLNSIKSALPDARIIVIMDETLGVNIRSHFITACNYYAVEWIIPKKVSKQNSHPNKEGMKAISTQIMEMLKKAEESKK